MDFLHLSDLHYHQDPADNQAADQTMAYVQQHYPNHYLIVTGDITDDGHSDQYRNAMRVLSPFLGRIFIVPGNHDFGALGNFYDRERAERFDEMLAGPLHQGGSFHGYNQPVVNVVREGNDAVMLIALDSNLETDSPFDFACGEVGDGQLKGLDRILAQAGPAMKKIVLLHHHPFIVNDPFMELMDARKLMRAIYQRADVLMFGHKHESKLWGPKEVNGLSYALAADNSPGKAFARQLTVSGGRISVSDVPIA